MNAGESPAGVFSFTLSSKFLRGRSGKTLVSGLGDSPEKPNLRLGPDERSLEEGKRRRVCVTRSLSTT